MRIHFIFMNVICMILAACNVPMIDTNTDEIDSALPTGSVETLQSIGTVKPSGIETRTTYLEQQSTHPVETPSTLTPTLTPTTDLTATLEPGIGSISGLINNYVFGAIPQLTIVAFEQNPPYHYWYLILGAGNTGYSMDEYISSGKYQVVAYDQVGHKGGCISIVVVKKNQMATCDITDWTGIYPDKPAGVP